MALHANFVEDDAPARRFARGRTAGPIGALEFLDQLLLLRRRLAHRAINFADQFHHLRVLEVTQLPHDFGGQVALRHRAGLHRAEQRLRETGARGERAERVALLAGIERGVDFQNRIRCARVIERGDGPQRRAAHGGVVEQTEDEIRQLGIFRLAQGGECGLT